MKRKVIAFLAALSTASTAFAGVSAPNVSVTELTAKMQNGEMTGKEYGQALVDLVNAGMTPETLLAEVSQGLNPLAQRELKMNAMTYSQTGSKDSLVNIATILANQSGASYASGARNFVCKGGSAIVIFSSLVAAAVIGLGLSIKYSPGDEPKDESISKKNDYPRNVADREQAWNDLQLLVNSGSASSQLLVTTSNRLANAEARVRSTDPQAQIEAETRYNREHSEWKSDKEKYGTALTIGSVAGLALIIGAFYCEGTN